MDDDARDGSGQNLLRPLSQPNLASRFPSLRRINSTEPYKHRSLPAEPSPGSERASSEITFAVLYDEGPDYHVGHMDDRGSIHSGHQRPDSVASFAPSFHTRDSRNVSEEHYHDRNQDFVQNQRLLAEGYLNADTSYDPHSTPRYRTPSEETLAMNTLHNSYSNNEKRGLNQESSHSRDSWCTCDEDHGHSMPDQDRKDPSQFDVEAQNPPTTPTTMLTEKKPSKGLVVCILVALRTFCSNALQVKFNGDDDPLDPKNFPSNKKWWITGVTAAFTFVSPLASSMIAPALPQMAKEFHVTNLIEVQMMLSIFVLAYAIGPMFLGPLSELYGRSSVLQISNLVFLGFNTACGFAQSEQQLLAFRFLSGIGGSAPLAIGGGVLGDLFKPEERGKAMGLYAMGPLLGPAVGPIVGSWVAEYSTWRWIFWASSAADLAIAILGFWKMHECYAPYILHKKAKLMRKQTGNNAYRAEGEEGVDQPVIKKVASVMGRSFAMLFTQPIVQVMSIYMAFSYGVLYLGLSTLAELYNKPVSEGGYGQSLGISGLHYIALGLGFFIGAPVCGKSSDSMYQYFKKKDPRGQGKPEYRMPLVIPFSFLVPIGLLIYGWSAQYQVHWIVPDIGLFFFGMGTIAAFQCVTTYLVDSYARYAASAVAAVTILRSLAGFTFPLFAPAMFGALGKGWGNTVLALAAVGIGIPIPILLWMFGEKLRKRSSLALKPTPPGRSGTNQRSQRRPEVGRAPSGPQGPPPPFSEGKRRHG